MAFTRERLALYSKVLRMEGGGRGRHTRREGGRERRSCEPV